MAAENCLWGAPRIHGELLKLGITISERTVSRYLRRCPTTRSQTWRTFFANQFGGQTLISPVMFADAHDDDFVVDRSDLSFRPAPSIDASRASIHRPSWPKSPSGRQERARAAAVTRRGTYRCNQPRGVRAGVFSYWATVPSRPTAV